MSRRALKLMKEIVSTYYKCTLSVVTQRLNVSGHMLIWTFFLIWYVELVPKNFLTFQLHYHLFTVYLAERR
jgi:hypothetical protein